MVLGMDIVIGMKLIRPVTYNLNDARDGYSNVNETDMTDKI